MSVIKRGAVYWIRYAGPHGQDVRETTGQSDRRVAEAMEAQRRREVRDGTWQPRLQRAEILFGDYAEKWIRRQHDRGLHTAHDYEARTRQHVLPVFGRRVFVSIRPKDVEKFVDGLKRGPLAPRTIHHVYDCLRSICRDAAFDEVIPFSPCMVRPGMLPKKKDKDPRWRVGAIFATDEAQRLIWDPRVPELRRVMYGLLFFTGTRFGEAAGRRWRDIDTGTDPLHRLIVATQYDDADLKTERPRVVPIHPVLAELLEEWRLHGYHRTFGRHPTPDDWIAPNHDGELWAVRRFGDRRTRDLEVLGLRHRRSHDTRRTFTSLCRAGGADRDVVKAITHGPSTDVLDMYTTYPWATLCDAVLRFPVTRPSGEVVALDRTIHRTAAATETKNPGGYPGFYGAADGTRSRGRKRDRE